MAEVTEPTSTAGILMKQSHGTFRHWSKRHFVLRHGCLHWSHEDMPVDCPGSMENRSFIDFSRTPCDLIVLEGSRLLLQPTHGFMWNTNDRHSSAGTAQPLMLMSEQSCELKESLREHIAFGRDLRASCKQRDRERVMGLVSVGPDDLAEELYEKTGKSTCAVCLLELFPDVERNNDLISVAVVSGGSQEGINHSNSNGSRKGRGLVVKTPCQHYFHRTCLNVWVMKSGTCPVCETDMTSQKPPHCKSSESVVSTGSSAASTVATDRSLSNRSLGWIMHRNSA
mmetsp:Transcript_171876/g.550831  ORF Transcript_171876/g.550831 Transcript_171876/m.550831 type:complete len:283 (+) Transcript_171876:67-915(+)|eukprot:CAMPEP_0203957076 /NCGR_PEP_ID=MMETSP0359-20131031/89081_1 /ASSEMBLY_ACC=CAM_ASM_000338 /TAXON_ID=268821 /ORGANISM="Scrippsiella Hangoei, Strain SHTV-5" /LENGTH=282 /DNA_ID=CAMNT_0050890883 /DNA_START=44 /DNA_END=892 /DNA_ORIENTATION=+